MSVERKAKQNMGVKVCEEGANGKILEKETVMKQTRRGETRMDEGS